MGAKVHVLKAVSYTHLYVMHIRIPDYDFLTGNARPKAAPRKKKAAPVAGGTTGVLTAVAPGYTEISVTTKSGGYKDTVKLSV